MTLSRAKSKVLVIEDQSEIATTIEDILQRVGFEVTLAKTCPQAIRSARNNEFDLILLAVELPGMNGFEVCAWLKQDFRFGRTPIILLAGQLTPEDRRRGYDAGAADFIIKPFDPFIFVSRILSHIKPAK